MTDSDNKGEDYEVGYGKPPEHTRFQKGKSGNPKGRPKGHKNFKTDLLDELGETIAIHENGKTRRITKQRAMIKSAVAKAIKGDNKAANSIFSMASKDLPDAIEESNPVDLTETDQMILEEFKQAILKSASAKKDE